MQSKKGITILSVYYVTSSFPLNFLFFCMKVQGKLLCRELCEKMRPFCN